MTENNILPKTAAKAVVKKPPVARKRAIPKADVVKPEKKK